MKIKSIIFEVKNFIRELPDKICRFIACHLPRRIVYFTIIQGFADYSRTTKKEVGKITWDEVTKWLEKK